MLPKREFVLKEREDWAMTRSVEELRRNSERDRAALATTVSQLKDQLSDTAEDLRHKVSPQHIKSEVADYLGHKTGGWLDSLKQRARDNPMQAVAAAAAVGVPLLRLARGVPLPLLMIGAGLALTSKGVRERAADAAGLAMDKAGGVLNQATERAQVHASDLNDTAGSAQSRVTGVTEAVASRMAQTGAMLTDNLNAGADAATSALGQVRSAANGALDSVRAAPEKARGAIGENALVIGSLGIAMGAVIAAALPTTRAEAKVMGTASDRVKETLKESTQAGVEAVKDKTVSAADAAAQSVADADLGAHASRMTRNVADTLKEAADDAVEAAFNPSRTPNT